MLLGGGLSGALLPQAGEPLNALNLNIVNLIFLLLGFLLHGTPARLMRAVQEATPAVWGVILQFPFYAGIAGDHHGHALERASRATVRRVSTPRDVSGDGRALLGRARRVRPVRRIEMGDRSALRDGGGARAARAPRLGRGGLRSRRSAREPGAAVLDAAGAGAVSAPRARRHGLHLRRLSRARAGRAAARDLLGATLSYPL